jgi:HD superfamily phosphohydrolase YqeK
MGEIKLVLWTQTSSLSENRRSHFLQVSKMATLMHNKTNRVALKNVLILNIIHDILNFRSTEIVICIILDLIKRVNGLSHHLNIK